MCNIVGLSAITVDEEVKIASYFFLSFLTSSLAEFEVIHFESPVLVAIFPSIVVAVFNATKGEVPTTEQIVEEFNERLGKK